MSDRELRLALLTMVMEAMPRPTRDAYTECELQYPHADARLRASVNGIVFYVEWDGEAVRVYNPRFFTLSRDNFKAELCDPRLPELVWGYVVAHRECDYSSSR